MILAGDIAVPEKKYALQLERQLCNHSSIFKGKELIFNLEGLIMDDFSTETDTPVLFNHPEVLPVLQKWNTKAVTLANNHTLDRPSKFDNTRKLLDQNKIAFSGAGIEKKYAEQPALFTSEGKDVVLFNQCWHVMLQHQNNPAEGVYVATIREQALLDQIKKKRNSDPNAAIVVYFHWNFDLETLPFPLHRKLSRDLIDAGANVVVGCHSHCIQGGEKYNEGYIIYGLGNFFVPWYTFINGRISFPEFAKKEMVLEWCPNTHKANVHFFQYEPAGKEHQLIHEESASFENSEMLKRYSLYSEMSQDEYVSYFKKKRRKKL